MKQHEKDVFQSRRDAMVAQITQDFSESGSIITTSYDNLLACARGGLFDADPEKQVAALQAFLSFSRTRHFAPGELPPNVFQNLMEKLFGDHGCFRVREATLVLIEELCYSSTWCVQTFMSLGLHERAFKELVNMNSEFPCDRMSYVLNAMLLNDRQAFDAIMKLGYFEFLRRYVIADKIEITDRFWMLTAIQSIIVCAHLEDYTAIEEVLAISIRILDLHNVNLANISFSIIARIIAGQEPKHPIVERATAPNLVDLAMTLFNPASNPDVGDILDYFINFVCLSDDHTMGLVNKGFLARAADVFPKLTGTQKAKVFEVLANIVVDPPEAREMVLESPLLGAIPGILQSGELCLKKAVMLFLVRVIAKSDIREALSLLSRLDIISLIIDLLYSDDREIIISVIRAIGLLLARGKRLDTAQTQFITDQFDDVVIEQLYELTRSQSDEISQNATNLLKLLPPV